MKYKGIIFDLDGVLVHTDQLHFRAWKKIADEKGIEFDEEINNQLRGVSRMESLEIILRKYEGPEAFPKMTRKLLQKKKTIITEKN